MECSFCKGKVEFYCPNCDGKVVINSPTANLNGTFYSEQYVAKLKVERDDARRELCIEKKSKFDCAAADNYKDAKEYARLRQWTGLFKGDTND